MTCIYVIFLYESKGLYYVKIGKSVNLEERLRTFKTVCPHAEILTWKHENRNMNEKKLLEIIKEKYTQVGEEVFSLNQEEATSFSSDISIHLDLNGHDKMTTSFYPITGCIYSHYRQKGFWPHEHQNGCDDRCEEKRKADEEERLWVEEYCPEAVIRKKVERGQILFA